MPTGEGVSAGGLAERASELGIGAPDMELLGNDALDRSSVVANRQMNRDRTLTGSNGYAKEIGFNPLELLKTKGQGAVSWLDLCCGSGRALIEAARIWRASNLEITGVDLVLPRSPLHSGSKCLRLIQASLADWQPSDQFDIITCVHGLHYIGDKLGLIARAASWLKVDGQFVANLDIRDIILADGRSSSIIVGRELRKAGLEYVSRKKLLCCPGRMQVRLPFRYLGADDRAGPNYTKQPVVASHYTWMECEPGG